MPRPEWTPGDLSNTEIKGVLVDILADLWQDSWRRGEATFQTHQFNEILKDAVWVATGQTVEIR